MERNMKDLFEKSGVVTVPINPPISKNGPRLVNGRSYSQNISKLIYGS